MDLIRIYNEIAFARVAKSFLSGHSMVTPSTNAFILPEEYFLDQGRRFHPELSDDNLRMIYRLGEDEWSRYGYDSNCADPRNIFQTLAYFACEMLEDNGDWPIVHFKDLFRWRETTQILGEDLLSCAFLSYKDRELSKKNLRHFDWPSVLHNDNPHLTYLFKTKRLCELHSHLQASTNVFEITWVSLMNFIGGKQSKFEELANIHIPSKKKEVGETLYRHTVEAACLRWSIYEWLKAEGELNLASTEHAYDSDVVFNNKWGEFADLALEDRAEKVDSYTDSERGVHVEDKPGDGCPDYILATNSPMAVYAGERLFLYSTLKKIFASNNSRITVAFYRYVLAKSLLRSFFVQINNNIGFSNFQRFQSVKSKLLSSGYGYRNLLKSLPLWEARKHNYVKIFETRMVPDVARKELDKNRKTISSLIRVENDDLSETGNPKMDD